MRRRVGAIALTTAAVLVGTTACSGGTTGGDSDKPEGDGTVTVFHRWTESHKDAVENTLERCNAELPDIEIEISSVPPGDYEVQLPVTLSSASPPDIYALWPGGRPLFQAENGVIAPITDFYNETVAPRYVEGVNLGATEVDGEVYVMPFNVQPNEFYYRTDVFEELGLSAPTTWDEFVDVTEKIAASGVTPIILGSSLGWEPLLWFDYLVMRTAGPEFRARLMQGEESYLDPKVVEAMDLWADLLEAGAFNDNITSISWDEMTPAMADGRAAMMLMGPWAVDALTNSGLVPGQDFEAFPFPEIDPSAGPSAEGAMEGWATSGARDNAEDVYAVLDCFSSTAQATEYVQEFPVLSPNREVTLDVFSDEVRPFAEGWKALTEEGSFQQNLELATSPQVTDVAKREFARFLANPDEAQRVLEALEQASQQAFGS
ncbi:extracellular solute-binding protein [Microbacterium awajiense]|uniref:Extracellular solute-binding protein n=1 Tax=Microbacterium awajiense TaxID=415214 RepID=A0ABP7ASG9_9MICO